MARNARMLGVAELAKITAVGRHAAGGKLYMELSDAGTRRWLVRYVRDGKPTWQTLGKVDVARWPESLRLARQQAREVFDAIDRGDDPRAVEGAPAGKPMVGRVTFGAALESFLALRAAAWTNERYAKQTEATLKDYTATLARRPVADITTSEVASALQHHWRRVPVRANRMREQVAKVFDFCIDEGWRTAANPASLRRIVNALGKVQREASHHPAMPWRELPALMRKLAAIDDPAARALRLAILTGGRTKEAREAVRSEFNTAADATVWTLGGSRMKKRRVHRVPLSLAAIRVLEECQGDGERLLFPGLGETALYKCLTRDCGVNVGDASVHGMRSTFRDWVEDNNVARDAVAEVALAHTVKGRDKAGDKTRLAYLRTELFAEHRRLMDAWGEYLCPDAYFG
jgi:integrase